MSLSDSRILPALYDGLATPPLSPTRTHTTPRHSPSYPRTPLTLSSAPPSPPESHPPHVPKHARSTLTPLIVPSTSNAFATTRPAKHVAIVLSPTDHLHGPASINGDTYEPIYSLPRSLLPSKLLPPSLPSPAPADDAASTLPHYPTQIHVDTSAESLTRERKGKMPALSHLLSVGSGRVLALAADEKYVYAGCQSSDNEIVVFSRNSLQPLFRLLGHQGSILALMVVKEKGWLVSSSSAGDVRIWCTQNLEPVYIIHPCDDTAGDIYSLAWDNRHGGTLYFGSQGATIEWINFSPKAAPRQRKPSTSAAKASVTVPVVNGAAERGTTPPSTQAQAQAQAQRSGRYRPHAFFDNPPSSAVSSGASTPRRGSHHHTPSYPKSPMLNVDLEQVSLGSPRSEPVQELEVAAEDRLAFAHIGYVYALQTISRPDGCWLVSGSGDSDVKIWRAHSGGGLKLHRTFSDLSGAVLSFAYRDSLLYAGLQDGEILVWDIETGACIRAIDVHDADVMTMSALGGEVYTAGADGRVLRLNEEFDCTAAFKAHAGIVLSSCVVQGLSSGWDLITAGNDSFVKVWSIDLPQNPVLDTDLKVEGEGDVMLYALSKLVAIPTVSDDAHRESCRRGAHLLQKILSQLGASAQVISGEQGKNPLVLATFTATRQPTSSTSLEYDTSDSPSSAADSVSASESRAPAKRKRILFYGHYDVQPASEAKWATDPWELSGRNGYLYGRGVSDNKGPILAVACAASTLRRNRELEVDVVMIIEGEEEAGSSGFAAAVRRHKASIGHIDSILLSNSTWIGEEDPCVVYGMRGVVYANLSISSCGADAHSGVDGGMVAEPMFDMVRVLAAVADGQGVRLPGFYDKVRAGSVEETALLSSVAAASNRRPADLSKIWCQPSFSIANITSSSASANKTVIPKAVSADISMRLVPDQELGEVVEGLRRFCKERFDELGSSNKFEITITHSASWWLASLQNPYLLALSTAINDVWGKAPLKIREGGTVPTIFWLEQEFGAPCVHLPLGQASDAGHLANERMRLLNLRNGKRVVEGWLGRVARL